MFVTCAGFYNNLWGLGVEQEYGCPTATEPVFLNVYGDPELIPRNEFRQPM